MTNKRDPTSKSQPSFEWIGEPHPELEEQLLEDLKQDGIYREGEDLSRLSLHSHFLTDDVENGPMVYTYWEDDHVMAEYVSQSNWVTISEAAKRFTGGDKKS